MAVVYIYIRKLIEKKNKIDLLLTMIISISATMYLFTEIEKKKETATVNQCYRLKSFFYFRLLLFR